MGGNASSVHQLGRRARRVLHTARAHVHTLCGADAAHNDVVFCASLAETRALSILGLAWSQRRAHGRRAVVLDASLWTRCPGMLQQLCLSGFVVGQLQRGVRGGQLSMRRFALGQDPWAHALEPIDSQDVAVLAVAALGLDGQMPPWPALAVWAQQHGAQLVIDAATAAGRIPLETDAWHAAAVCVDSAPLGGPPGIAALMLRKETKIQPLWEGGGQNLGHRSGTEAVVLAAGLGEAARQAHQMRASEAERLGQLRVALCAGVAQFVLPTDCQDLVLWPQPIERVTSCVGFFDAEDIMVGWTPGWPGSTQAHVCLTLGYDTTAATVPRARLALHRVLAASKDDKCAS